MVLNEDFTLKLVFCVIPNTISLSLSSLHVIFFVYLLVYASIYGRRYKCEMSNIR